MTVLVATDLDRTLIFSAGAAGPAFVPPTDEPPGEATPDPPVCVEHYDGAPLSYMLRSAHRDLGEAMGSGLVVPVTTRTVEQYRRVRLPGPVPPFAVCLNGGRLLVDGVEDEAYTRTVGVRLGADAAPFAVVAEHVRRLSSSATGDPHPWVKMVRDASGLFCYVVCHAATWPAGWLADVREVARSHGWVVSVQGRKVYVVPGPLTKQAAVAHVAGRLGVDAVHATGDSLLDEEMVLASSQGLVPRGSELHRAHPVLAPHVACTVEPGLAGGREVAAWTRRSVVA